MRRALAEGPRNVDGAIELRGFPGIWRIKLTVGNRRLIFRVESETQRITVLEIISREEAYEKYPFPDEDMFA